MPSPTTAVLTEQEIEGVAVRVSAAAEAGNPELAWKTLRPLLRAQTRQRTAAVALTRLVEQRSLDFARGLEALVAVERSHPADWPLLALVAEALEGACDLDDLNRAPPDHPLFAAIVAKLSGHAAVARVEGWEQGLLSGLASAARMCGRRHDDLAAGAYRRLVELEPGRSSAHYNLGLFLKTRGHFREGLAANRRAIELAGERVDSYEWNLGICATGAREGAAALEVWKRLGQNIESGRFDLPEGRYPSCKVKLAQRPLAERTVDDDDPGLEETIWIERLSPCHGIVRSVLFQDLGADYGDVVLFDGAPITHHRHGEREIPVFPQLATLVRGGYQFFDFAGTQSGPGRLASASDDLEGDAVVYSHSENFRVLCATCWRGGDVDHEHRQTEERHVVTGRIAAPPHVDPRVLLAQLDRAVAARQPCRLYVPSLCEAAGSMARAAVERRRYALLRDNA